MSKKNKHKFANQETSANNSVETTAENTAKPQKDSDTYDMTKEFKRLTMTTAFLIALLAGLYYYDLQTHFLQDLTNKFFALF